MDEITLLVENFMRLASIGGIKYNETQKNLSTKPSQLKMTNCKNCGAPLHGNRCEYCGTEYAEK